MARPVFTYLSPYLIRAHGSSITERLYGNVHRVVKNGFRWYECDEGISVPSVTTILDRVPNPQLEAWKKREGKNAERISHVAKHQGHFLHESIESYLRNKDNFPQDTPYYVIDLFRKLQPELNKINNIQFLEDQMICPTHAGTADAIAMYDNCTSIIDFKTSGREPHPNTIRKYFTQTAAYFELWENRYPYWKSQIQSQYVPQQFVILVAVQDEPMPYVYIEKMKFGTNCDMTSPGLENWKELKKRVLDEIRPVE